MKQPLSSAFLARAQAVKQAHAHLAQTHPTWARLSQPERFRLVHQHVDAGASLKGRLGQLTQQGRFGCK